MTIHDFVLEQTGHTLAQHTELPEPRTTHSSKTTQSNPTKRRQRNSYSFDFPTPQISAPGLFIFSPTTPVVGAGVLPTIKLLALLSVSSASRSILEIRLLHVGMSWMRPMTWPAVHTYILRDEHHHYT